jgi:hypothetical protein
MTTSIEDVRPATAVHIPAWLPRESLYGWSARYHATFGFKATETGKFLFGREHAPRMRDLPVGLARFSAATGHLLGDPVDILRQRTVVGLHWPFLSFDARARVTRAALDSDGPPMAAVLGLAPMRLGAQSALRHCERCVREGHTTRFVQQQLPGTWYCTVHCEPLHEERSAMSGYEVPECSTGHRLRDPRSEREERSLQLAARLGAQIMELQWVDIESLATSCLHRLHVLGVSSERRLNMSRVDDWFERSAISHWMTADGGIRRPRRGWIARLLRRRERPHPLKWILLWCALWEREPVESALTGFQQAVAGLKGWVPFSSNTYSTYNVPRNARTASDEVRQAFKKSSTIEQAAMILGITPIEAEELLFDDPKLSELWVQARSIRLSGDARERIEAFLARHEGVGFDQVAQACARDVAWLRAHSIGTLRSLLANARILGGFDVQSENLQLLF